MSIPDFEPQSTGIVLPFGERHVYSPSDYEALQYANPSHYFLRVSQALPISRRQDDAQIMQMAAGFSQQFGRFTDYSPDITIAVIPDSPQRKFVSISAVSSENMALMSGPFSPEYYSGYSVDQSQYMGAALSEHIYVFTRSDEFIRLRHQRGNRIAILGCATPLNYIAMVEEIARLGIDATIDTFDITALPMEQLAPYCRDGDRAIIADATQLDPLEFGEYDAIFADFLVNCMNPLAHNSLYRSVYGILQPSGYFFMSHVCDLEFEKHLLPPLPNTISAASTFYGNVNFYLQQEDLVTHLWDNGFSTELLDQSLNRKLTSYDKTDRYFVCYK